MNKNLKTLFTVTLAFGLGLGINNLAISSTPPTFKVAVVDIPKLVDSSGQIKNLKNEQLKKVEELKKFVDTAKADVEKQSTTENKQKLAKKYEDSLSAKQQANAEVYSKKLSEIDKNISDMVSKKATAENYDLVIAKNSVLYGGEDITNAIAIMIK